MANEICVSNANYTFRWHRFRLIWNLVEIVQDIGIVSGLTSVPMLRGIYGDYFRYQSLSIRALYLYYRASLQIDCQIANKKVR
jgi:hypothetical protein